MPACRPDAQYRGALGARRYVEFRPGGGTKSWQVAGTNHTSDVPAREALLVWVRLKEVPQTADML